MQYSIIVPLYNKAQYIEHTLHSIANQTYQDYELIVIDDGSTDGSYEIAESMINNRINNGRIIRQENSGVSVTRNHGVSISRGDYVTFLDADDWWEPTFLEEMTNLISEFPDAGLYGTSYYLIKNGRKRVAPIGLSKGFKKGYINYCKIYSQSLCMPITSSSVAIKREIFNETEGFREGITLGEDFDLWIRLALKHPTVLINKPLSNYFQDIPPQKRATRRLHDPSTHMLWNLDYLSEEEKNNQDLKILLDRLRAGGLFRYYLSRNYHPKALTELSKIEWTNVSRQAYKKYHSPLTIQRILDCCRKLGASIKKHII